MVRVLFLCFCLVTAVPQFVANQVVYGTTSPTCVRAVFPQPITLGNTIIIGLANAMNAGNFSVFDETGTPYRQIALYTTQDPYGQALFYYPITFITPGGGFKVVACGPSGTDFYMLE